ncbi:nitroreductase [Nocardioides ochotonae]|uniref:nitroreductase n=1 Tax=Nocardioides ochotonae TaxID=2685869 RepID=UPI001CD775CA|nr:nitroreductase [Nocardioides ochotonae]
MPSLSTRSVAEVAAARHSCRAFTDRSVEPALVRELLQTAQLAPSWCNVQPWQVHVTAGDQTDALRRFLAERIPEATASYDVTPPGPYTGVHAERRRQSGLALYDSVGIAREDKAARFAQAWRNFTFFDAPHVAVLSVDSDLGPYALVDAGVWLSHFLLAATDVGVATIAQAAIASYSPLVREFFDLPDERHVVCAVSFGYADEGDVVNDFRTTRADLADVVDARGFDSWE